MQKDNCRTPIAKRQLQTIIAKRHLQNGNCKMTNAKRQFQNDNCKTTIVKRQSQNDNCKTTVAKQQLQNDNCKTTIAKRQLQNDNCKTTIAKQHLQNTIATHSCKTSIAKQQLKNKRCLRFLQNMSWTPPGRHHKTLRKCTVAPGWRTPPECPTDILQKVLRTPIVCDYHWGTNPDAKHLAKNLNCCFHTILL